MPGGRLVEEEERRRQRERPRDLGPPLVPVGQGPGLPFGDGGKLEAVQELPHRVVRLLAPML
jgi:hypothetical protein